MFFSVRSFINLKHILLYYYKNSPAEAIRNTTIPRADNHNREYSTKYSTIQF